MAAPILSNETRGKLGEAAAKYILRTERGESLMGHVVDLPRDCAQGIVLLFAAEGYFNVTIPFVVLPAFVVAKKIAAYMCGWKDEIIGFW